MPRIGFITKGLQGLCPEGVTILDAIRGLGYIIDHACGGNARCGTCCVRVLRGEESLSAVGPEEAAQLAELGVAAPHRLSCQARVKGDIIVVSAGC
jgi:2Fe-2S ferredoxin